MPCAHPFIPQTTESLGFLCMFTLASVVDPRLFDPRVCDDKTYITTLGMQQTFAMVGLPTVTGQAGKTEPGDFFHPCQGLLPGHSGMKEFLPGSSLSCVVLFFFWFGLFCWLLEESRSTMWRPGKTKQRAARTKVPAHVGWTR